MGDDMTLVDTPARLNEKGYVGSSQPTSGSLSGFIQSLIDISSYRGDFAGTILVDYFFGKKCDAFQTESNDLEVEYARRLRNGYILSAQLISKPNVQTNLNIDLINELLDIENQLHSLEELSGLVSNVFYEKWLNDEMPDTFTNNAWAILVEARNSILGY
jgi:hypothetical protein